MRIHGTWFAAANCKCELFVRAGRAEMSFFYDREREKSLTFLRILLNLDSMVIIIVITGSSRRGLWKRSEANVEYGGKMAGIEIVPIFQFRDRSNEAIGETFLWVKRFFPNQLCGNL